MLKTSKIRFCVFFLIFLCIAGCHTNLFKSRSNIENVILMKQDNFFYLDIKNYPAQSKYLPIGIFDSGTGGLTVLEQILKFDEFNNENHEYIVSGDGISDFKSESFIYLGDQANMPYGEYPGKNKESLLKEHIIKNMQFLMGNKYYLNAGDNEYKIDKQPVKVIVIACNTATAYGKSDIERFLQRADLNIKVIGVIDAGVKAALDFFSKTENGSIAVMATAGTVSSMGYVNAINSHKRERDFSGDISVFQQAGIGLAGAIDGLIEHISFDATKPRKEYKGPGLAHPDASIDTSILSRYGFDWENNRMLFDGNKENPQNIQINSINNYISYHLVSLLEKISKHDQAQPLKAIILGCTHYPFFKEIFIKKLQQLYNYTENGQFVYRKIMTPNIKLIDPAQNTAKELYEYLKSLGLYNSSDLSKSEFYISVPNKLNENVQLDSLGNFTYDYKYGRDEGFIQEYVKRVPFSKSTISSETASRLETGVPVTFGLIKSFNESSLKMKEVQEIFKF